MPLELPDWGRLDHIENPEDEKTCCNGAQRKRQTEQGHTHAGNFVDHDTAGVLGLEHPFRVMRHPYGAQDN